MASQKTKRRSRKARAASRGNALSPSGQPGAVESPGPAGAGVRVAPKVSPRAAPALTRRQQREERERLAARESAMASRSLGTYGSRPRSIFHPVPVAEFAIFAGIIAVIVGLLHHGGPALKVGAIVCALGVLEFTAREHFSGFRSHTTLLAAVPAIVVEILLAKFVGVPTKRILLLAPVVPVFALSFWVLRRSFATARHARVARPSAP
jgi:hypothetical protein